MARFDKISPHWQIFGGLFIFLENSEPNLANLWHNWANFHCCMWLNNEKYSNHLVALAFVILVEFASTNLHQMRQMCGGSKVVCQNVAIVCMRCQ